MPELVKSRSIENLPIFPKYTFFKQVPPLKANLDKMLSDKTRKA
jgi:hypothetical protein